MREWAHDGELEWPLLQQRDHAGMLRWMSDLNALYRAQPSLHDVDFAAEGFEWIDARDAESSVIAFVRRARSATPVLVVCNFTPVPRYNYVLGVPTSGYWRELLNSDAVDYGGGGIGNLGGVHAAPVAAHGRFQSLTLTLPPLATLFLARTDD